MAVTSANFAGLVAAIFNKEIDLLDDTIKVALTTSTFVPALDTHDYFNDVTNEVVGTGYTAAGASVTTDTLTYTAATNTWMYDGDDTQWTSSTITARIAVIYDSTPATDATRPLISYQDFGADQTSSAGTFKIQWAAAGIFTVVIGAAA